MSSLKSQWAEILVARRVEQVKGEPLCSKPHQRRGDRDAALALDRHPIRAHPPPLALTSPASWIAPPNSSNFLGQCSNRGASGRFSVSPRSCISLSSSRVFPHIAFAILTHLPRADDP